MKARSQGPIPAGSSEKEKETAATQAGDDACRCKETAEMTPRELFRLMMRDLAFWKKEKKD